MPAPDDPVTAVVAHDDESIRIDIAVRALGDMRSRATAPASGDCKSSHLIYAWVTELHGLFFFS